MADDDGLSELERRRRRRIAKTQAASTPTTDAEWAQLERGGRGACEAMDGMNAPPAGVMMEMQLARERDRELGEGANVVDQSQFRNTQINEGYQWHKVKRQAVASHDGPGKVVDMTKGGRLDAAERKRKKQMAPGYMKRKRVEIAPGIFAEWHEEQSGAKKQKKEKKEKRKKKDKKKKDKKKKKKKKKNDKKEKKEGSDSDSSGSSNNSDSE